MRKCCVSEQKHYYIDEKDAQIVIALLKAHDAVCMTGESVHGV